MLNCRSDIALPLPCHPPACLPADSVCSSALSLSSFPQNRNVCLFLPDQIILFIDLLLFAECCVRFFFSSFLDSFPGLWAHLWSCLQINSPGEIGTFQKQQSIPVYLQHLWDVAVPDDKDCNCICWVVAHKQYACFNCVWLLAVECIRHTNEKKGEVRCNLA